MSVRSQSPVWVDMWSQGKRRKGKEHFTLSLTPLTVLCLKTLETKSKTCELKCKNREREDKRSKKRKKIQKRRRFKNRGMRKHMRRWEKGFPELWNHKAPVSGFLPTEIKCIYLLKGAEHKTLGAVSYQFHVFPGKCLFFFISLPKYINLSFIYFYMVMLSYSHSVLFISAALLNTLSEWSKENYTVTCKVGFLFRSVVCFANTLHFGT